jgi:hypothetical protein
VVRVITADGKVCGVVSTGTDLELGSRRFTVAAACPSAGEVRSIGIRLRATTVLHPESTAYCPATNRATAALVMTPWVTPTHASPACSTAG